MFLLFIKKVFVVVFRELNLITFILYLLVSYSSLPNSSWSFIALLDSITITKTIIDAFSHPKWPVTMEEEIMAFGANVTFDVVSLLHGKNLIGCKWVFIIKVHPDGIVTQLKAWLVTKRYA